MLDLPAYPVLDKAQLIPGCVRLPFCIDAQRLEKEVGALAPELWGGRGGRIGVHRSAEAIFLRGHAPAEGDMPIEDRPPLKFLPYVREIINQLIPAKPMRCLLAKLPAGAAIAPHVDKAPYFSKTIRLHLPVVSNPLAWMVCSGMSYRMQPGEVWALNNSAMHAVWNAHSSNSRTHLICDFLPSEALMILLQRGESSLGARNPAVDAHLAGLQVLAQPGVPAR